MSFPLKEQRREEGQRLKREMEELRSGGAAGKTKPGGAEEDEEDEEDEDGEAAGGEGRGGATREREMKMEKEGAWRGVRGSVGVASGARGRR
eukprot:2201897-Rhodomonas_salina.1